ncbi:HupE/UreJ family protein [Roseomonas sp. PWR1]|uniref:HupE/UreJ family protein n=1 Tax=Roseomonas nitratireducens TaxID=2820810 RepID=A0ABS4ANG9_9PROT|nr:HupE/UreJ family protein [Neoroseomonas nitratireducens]MBP0462905.1 HupE/UreJ family protein [Neoroseomonas nitratireducens]
MTRFALSAAALVTTLLSAGPALAHGGHVLGFGAGFVHPLLGIDHLLAMVAIGIWAARGGLPRPWALPACFLGGMAVGIGLGVAAAIPPLEQTVAGTLVVLGVMVAITARVRAGIAFPAAALFGLVHGSVHGVEIGGAPLLTALGMLAASVALHALGFFAARGLARRDVFVRASGAAMASVGVMILLAG